MSPSALARRAGSVLLLGALLTQLPGIRNAHYGRRKHGVESERHQGFGYPKFGTSSDDGSSCRIYAGQAAENPANGIEDQEVVSVDTEPQSSAAQVAGDPFDDDDGALKKSDRKHQVTTTAKTVSKPPKNLPAADFLTSLGRQLVLRWHHQLELTYLLSHFGSGPCHSFPRPREDTILPIC